MRSAVFVLLFVMACKTTPPPDLSGTWAGVVDCDPGQSGWGDPATYTYDLVLNPDVEYYSGTLGFVWDATDATGSLYGAGAAVRLEFDLDQRTDLQGERVTITPVTCNDYTIVVNGDPDLDPATCDDISWEGMHEFVFDGTALQYDAGLPMPCSGALSR